MKKKAKIRDLRITVLDYLIWFLIIVIFSYIASVIINCFLLKVGIKGIFYVVSHRYTVLLTFGIFVLCFFPFLYVLQLQFERNYVLRRLMGMRKAVEGNLENAHFLTFREMEQNGYRIYTTMDALREADDGIILTFDEQKKDCPRIVFSPEVIHTLVLGTTGSGKTAGYIIPSIKVLANTKSKPSFLFTDPKGELNEKTAWYLKEQGYRVLVLDFRNPERSLRWNPLASAYEKYQKAQTIYEDTTLKTDGTFKFRGKTYDAENIEQAERTEEQRMEDAAYEEIQNIVHALCPVNARDPIWDNGARAFIQAVILAMLEDSIDVDCDMPIEKFCFYNVAKICGKTDNECAGLKEYFSYRKPTSLAVQYSGMVLNAPDKQQGSYMSSVAEKLLMFNDRGICNMTSGRSEIDVKEMDERPTAVYLVLPDEKEGRHPLGSLFIAQAYKKLVEKAVENGGRLKRNVYFMMDEYGNMPKIDGVASMFTVGRSRGIIQIPVIQAYSQITEKYGQETAKTIFGNCNTEIFIGAKDEDTCEKFSKKLGNYTVLATNVSGQKRLSEHNFSESLKERPLMYPRELTLLNNKQNMGNVVVINQGYSPTLGKFTPYFKSKIFENRTETDEGLNPRALDEQEIYYDHESRAKNIEKSVAEFEEYIERTERDESGEIDKRERVGYIDERDRAGVLKKLSALAAGANLKMTDNDAENLKIIGQMMQYYREKRELVRLNETIRLKSKYLAFAAEQEKE